MGGGEGGRGEWTVGFLLDNDDDDGKREWNVNTQTVKELSTRRTTNDIQAEFMDANRPT